jgi:alkylation response protein AidB-like acyl-CoA dehydrogenase
VNFGLSVAQRDVRERAAEFADRKVAPHAARWEQEDRFPNEVFEKLAETGFMGLCVPEEYGGGGTDFLSYALLIEEVSRADAGVGVTLAVHTSAGTLPILTVLWSRRPDGSRLLPGDRRSVASPSPSPRPAPTPRRYRRGPRRFRAGTGSRATSNGSPTAA